MPLTDTELARLLALPAGRELDAELCRLMGHEIEWRACHWYPDDSFWSETQSVDEANGHKVEISPDYGSVQPCYRGPHHEDGYPDWEVVRYLSTSIAAAWPLLAAMLAAGVSISLFYDERNGLVMLWGDDDVGMGRDENVPSLTDAPLAICRAWLVWVYSKEQAT